MKLVVIDQVNQYHCLPMARMLLLEHCGMMETAVRVDTHVCSNGTNPQIRENRWAMTWMVKLGMINQVDQSRCLPMARLLLLEYMATMETAVTVVTSEFILSAMVYDHCFTCP